jgi:SAM-dependent methyltransferase
MLKTLLKPLFIKARFPEGRGAGLFLRMMNLGHRRLSAWGLGFLKLEEGLSVLDVGCGGGLNIRRMLKSPVARVCGLDPSEASVKESRRAALKSGEGSRAEIRSGDASSIPWPDSEFDIITAFETVYFWPDQVKCFREVGRALKPGGLFLIVNSVNLAENARSSLFWADMLDFSEGARADYPKLLEEAGFERTEAAVSKTGLAVKGYKPELAGRGSQRS